jgi:hypothetical protein
MYSFTSIIAEYLETEIVKDCLGVKHLTNDVVKLRDFLVDLNELNVYGNIF